MIKHFLIRLLIVIVTIIFVSLLSFVFVLGASSSDELIIRVYMTSFFILFIIIAVIFVLIRDSKTQYRKQQEDKAKASLFVLFIFLFVAILAIFSVLTMK